MSEEVFTECKICKQQEGKPTPFRKINTTCMQCNKSVKKILDLHHTNAHLCSLKCEQSYWLDILY